MKDWYQIPEEEVLTRLETCSLGLKEETAARRLEDYGKNALREVKPKAWWKIFLEQFQDLLVQILIGAAVISMISGSRESTIVIFTVLILNAALGTVQHEKARKSLESLKTLSAPSAQVIRGGCKKKVPAAEVVPGDILVLETGDLAAADGRILEANALFLNESSLTGEAESVEKGRKVLQGEHSLADRSNMIFSGSLVTGGRGLAVVTATGMDTEIGKIAELMNDAGEKRTPLQISLDQFSSRLAMAIMGICLIVFLLGLYRGSQVLDALMFAVALAVAAIPEALGTIVTIVQAMGTQRMAKQNAIIKDLKAVESLGCVSVICSDKTGTLTQNKMTVQEIYENGTAVRVIGTSLGSRPDRAGRKGQLSIMEAAILANNAEIVSSQNKGTAKDSRKEYVGDPTETALLRMAAAHGNEICRIREKWVRLEEQPFDSRRKRMSVLCRRPDGKLVLIVKGAWDVLMPRCKEIEKNGKSSPITPEDIRKIKKQNEIWGKKGLRVLAFACRTEEKKTQEERKKGMDRETGLTFLGLAALMDPPRPETKEAVKKAREAGIKPVMITGDHPATARAIAEETGILFPGEGIITGPELDRISEEELDRQLEHISVCARVSPEHKIRIVEAWQKKGCVVAMTGDGVNDGPALKKADIGVAMGLDGTEVSRDAASMILADDNFATIISAVENGRNVYRNIQNAIDFLLSGNMAGIFCVLYTSLLALPMPFAPVHLLFINLVTDSLPALAIGMEPAEDGLLKQKPRDPSKGILSKAFLKDILIQGGLIAVCTMAAYYVGLTGGLGAGFHGIRETMAGMGEALAAIPWEVAGGLKILAEETTAAASALVSGEVVQAANILTLGRETAAVSSFSGSSAVAATMAFTTLTLARLFHGFNCRSHHSIFHLGVFTNLYSIMAFEAGTVLLAAVLFVPSLQTLFAASDLNLIQIMAAVGFSVIPTILIQGWKLAREWMQG